MRSQFCGKVTEAEAGNAVTLCGWVDGRRDLGGLIFLSIRDHSGIVQVVVEPESAAFSDAERLRNEYCVQITGEVRMRPESQWNGCHWSGVVQRLCTDPPVDDR
jgi:aspartyl-tRNA synthetase